MKKPNAAVLLSTIALGVLGCSGADSDETTASTEEALARSVFTRLICESRDHRYNSCDVDTQGGAIVRGRVVRQLSHSSCREGESFGFGSSYVWVDRGCRAEFEIEIAPARRPTVQIHRAYNGGIRDHLQGLSAYEGSPQWNYEGIGFHLFAEYVGGPALYRCRQNGSSYHFLSNDGNCEGHTYEGHLGYASSTPGAGLVQLYRCRDPQGADHMTTTNVGECHSAHWIVESGQGYAGY